MSENKIYKFLFNKKYLVLSALVSYWMVLIIGTSLPSESLPAFKVGDKVIHFIAYFGLGFLFGAYRLIYFNKNKKNVFIVILIVAIYALADEIHQIFIPGRYCELFDIFADIIGGLIGLGIAYLILIKKWSKIVV
ncbi:MAG: VanZ family protein [Melioribacteraceae bacterium]|nr:VanZ family protein [Melioribacteraceae bacterium]